MSDPTYPSTRPTDPDSESTNWINSFLPVPVQQQWSQTEIELILHQLLTEYYTACENYDRTVCTGPIIDGAIMPVTPLQRALISQNAATLWREFRRKADQIGATSGQVEHVRKNHDRRRY